MITLVVERHRDGKLFPVGHHRSDEELRRVVGLVHKLRCQQGLSYREVVAGLAQEGLRVSLGSVHHYARRFECDDCA